LREGRSAVLAFNKWDMIDDRQAVLADLREKTERLLPQARGIRAITIAGQTGEGLERLMQAVIDTDKVWNRRISTAKLNRWLDIQQTQHPPPAVSGRRLKLKYMTQVKARPPGFMVSCTRPEAIPESYTRYLINGLRKDFDLPGVPIRLHYKASANPFENRKKKR
jgi:GTPase